MKYTWRVITLIAVLTFLFAMFVLVTLRPFTHDVPIFSVVILDVMIIFSIYMYIKEWLSFNYGYNGFLLGVLNQE